MMNSKADGFPSELRKIFANDVDSDSDAELINIWLPIMFENNY